MKDNNLGKNIEPAIAAPNFLFLSLSSSAFLPKGARVIIIPNKKGGVGCGARQRDTKLRVFKASTAVRSGRRLLRQLRNECVLRLLVLVHARALEAGWSTYMMKVQLRLILPICD